MCAVICNISTTAWISPRATASVTMDTHLLLLLLFTCWERWKGNILLHLVGKQTMHYSRNNGFQTGRVCSGHQITSVTLRCLTSHAFVQTPVTAVQKYLLMATGNMLRRPAVDACWRERQPYSLQIMLMGHGYFYESRLPIWFCFQLEMLHLEMRIFGKSRSLHCTLKSYKVPESFQEKCEWITEGQGLMSMVGWLD